MTFPNSAAEEEKEGEWGGLEEDMGKPSEEGGWKKKKCSSCLTLHFTHLLSFSVCTNESSRP